MSNIDKRALREAAEKATKGEWWSDVVETDGEYGEGEDRVSGYHSYAVYVGHESLLDMTNSTAARIHTEWDHDYHMAWDETAKRNAEFIAAANPATVLALLDEIAELEQGHCGTALLEREEMHAKTLGRMLDELEAKDKRIAELEAREVKLPELKMLRDYLAEVTMREREDILVGVRLEFFRELEEAGVKVAAAGKGEAS